MTAEELLYECIRELEYVRLVCVCGGKSSRGPELIADGMKLLGVKDLSGETLKTAARA